MSLNTGIPPLRNSFYAKRPAVQVSDSEKSRVSQNGHREKKKKIKGSGKEKGTQKITKKVNPRDRQKLSILKRISNGITHGLETFFYK